MLLLLLHRINLLPRMLHPLRLKRSLLLLLMLPSLLLLLQLRLLSLSLFSLQ